MAFKAGNRVPYTSDGVPYVWGGGDITTAPSNETKITAFDAAEYDGFGSSVAVGSGRIAVGAPGDRPTGPGGTTTTFPGGFEVTDPIADGAVYIYDLQGNFVNKIAESTIGPGFGASVAIGSGRIVVGTPDEPSARLYDLEGNFVLDIAPTTPFNETNPRFGNRVAIDRDIIFVQAEQERFTPSSPGVTGALYIFDLSGNEIAKVFSPFGENGSIDEDFAVGNGVIAVGDRENDPQTGEQTRALCIYDYNGNLTKIIKKPEFGESSRFASQGIAVGAGRIAVGGTSSSGSTVILDKAGEEINIVSSSSFIQSDVLSISSGRIIVGDDQGGDVAVFDLDGNETSIIPEPYAFGTPGSFGNAVAAGNGKIVIGSLEDSDNGTKSGAVFIYDTPPVYTIYDAVEYERGNL